MLKNLSEHPTRMDREAMIAETRKAVAASINTDTLIIHAISTLEQLERIANQAVKKAREWYAAYNPEFEHGIEHDAFLAGAAEAIPGEGSMGGRLAEQDREALFTHVGAVKHLSEHTKELRAYIERRMTEHCPNLSELAGPVMAARLLNHAGSLQRLATMPSGTIQLLGAERALFRHLRDKRRHRSPKYGLIYNHPVVQRGGGKAARMLADKLSLCARLDYFKGERKADAYVAQLAGRFGGWQ